MYGNNTVNTHEMEYGRKGKKKTLNKNDPTNMPHPASKNIGDRRDFCRLLVWLTYHFPLRW